jgi:pimeloyl-ACP methyl ester carboxylesterase
MMRETTVVSADGTKLAARCSGGGSPLVLVHGAMADLNAFGRTEELLAERHSVWVYSRRGRGGSGDGPLYSLEREIEDILSVLEAAGDGAHLVGHSSGAFYCLLTAPRTRSLRSLVLYEPPLHVDTVEAAILDGVESALAAGEPGRALEIFFPVADIVEEEAAAIRALEPVWDALCKGVFVFPREHRALQADGRKLLSAAELPSVPMLYLYGELTEAPVFPTLDEVAKLLPKARFHCLPGQRHMAPVFDPTTFAQAVLAFTTAHGR